ncbi:conserved Plasmodium protein, unknown function [Plasmodium sp. DRC-Itaito]|nr:conserved Plasmodium protein, unknown function [Plasmodium sp. DRC-Itaito]
MFYVLPNISKISNRINKYKINYITTCRSYNKIFCFIHTLISSSKRNINNIRTLITCTDKKKIYDEHVKLLKYVLRLEKDFVYILKSKKNNECVINSNNKYYNNIRDYDDSIKYNDEDVISSFLYSSFNLSDDKIVSCCGENINLNVSSERNILYDHKKKENEDYSAIQKYSACVLYNNEKNIIKNRILLYNKINKLIDKKCNNIMSILLNKSYFTVLLSCVDIIRNKDIFNIFLFKCLYLNNQWIPILNYNMVISLFLNLSTLYCEEEKKKKNIYKYDNKYHKHHLYHMLLYNFLCIENICNVYKNILQVIIPLLIRNNKKMESTLYFNDMIKIAIMFFKIHRRNAFLVTNSNVEEFIIHKRISFLIYKMNRKNKNCKHDNINNNTNDIENHIYGRKKNQYIYGNNNNCYNDDNKHINKSIHTNISNTSIRNKHMVTKDVSYTDEEKKELSFCTFVDMTTLLYEIILFYKNISTNNIKINYEYIDDIWNNIITNIIIYIKNNIHMEIIKKEKYLPSLISLLYSLTVLNSNKLYESVFYIFERSIDIIHYLFKHNMNKINIMTYDELKNNLYISSVNMCNENNCDDNENNCDGNENNCDDNENNCDGNYENNCDNNNIIKYKHVDVKNKKDIKVKYNIYNMFNRNKKFKYKQNNIVHNYFNKIDPHFYNNFLFVHVPDLLYSEENCKDMFTLDELTKLLYSVSYYQKEKEKQNKNNKKEIYHIKDIILSLLPYVNTIIEGEIFKLLVNKNNTSSMIKNIENYNLNIIYNKVDPVVYMNKYTMSKIKNNNYEKNTSSKLSSYNNYHNICNDNTYVAQSSIYSIEKNISHLLNIYYQHKIVDIKIFYILTFFLAMPKKKYVDLIIFSNIINVLSKMYYTYEMYVILFYFVNYVYRIRISEHVLSEYFFRNGLVLKTVEKEHKEVIKEVIREVKRELQNGAQNGAQNGEPNESQNGEPNESQHEPPNESHNEPPNESHNEPPNESQNGGKKKSGSKQILPFYIWRFFLKNIQLNVKDEHVLNTLPPVNLIKIINGLIFYKIMDKKLIEIIMTRIENEYLSKELQIKLTRNKNNNYSNNNESTEKIDVYNKTYAIKKNINMCKKISCNDIYTLKKEKEKFNFICLNSLLNYMSQTNDIQYYNIKINLIKMIKNIIFKEEKFIDVRLLCSIFISYTRLNIYDKILFYDIYKKLQTQKLSFANILSILSYMNKTALYDKHILNKCCKDIFKKIHDTNVIQNNQLSHYIHFLFILTSISQLYLFKKFHIVLSYIFRVLYYIYIYINNQLVVIKNNENKNKNKEKNIEKNVEKNKEKNKEKKKKKNQSFEKDNINISSVITLLPNNFISMFDISLNILYHFFLLTPLYNHKNVIECVNISHLNILNSLLSYKYKHKYHVTPTPSDIQRSVLNILNKMFFGYRNIKVLYEYRMNNMPYQIDILIVKGV